MSKPKKDNSNFLISLFMSSVVLLVAILVWPKSGKVTQSNEINEKETQIQITVKRINIREKPTISSNDIGDVYKDEVYTVIDYTENEGYYWYQIKTNTNIEGFIASDPNEEYVKVISGVVDREGPSINYDKKFLIFDEGNIDISEVTCKDNYSNCEISYEDNVVSLIINAKDERGNVTTKEIPYYKVYNLNENNYENNKNLNASYNIKNNNGNKTIKVVYSLNRFIGRENKSINYDPVLIFYNDNFEELDTIVVKFNEQDLDSSCINNSNMSLKDEYKESDLNVSNKICVNYLILDNANIKYFRMGIEGVENYANDANYLANYYSKIYKW